jgi:UDP-glucose 4-epimerase
MSAKDKRYLIAGGASLVGSHIAEQLLAQGAARVTLLDNFSLGTPSIVQFLLKDERVKLLKGDLLRVNELYDALENVDGVFAVAAFLTLPLAANPNLGLDVNVRGMLNLLEACRYRSVKKIIFCSSVAVYGQYAADAITEDSPLSWQGLQPAGALYAATKVIGESLCRLYKQKHGVDYNALRYSTVYGERQHYRGVNALYIIEAYDAIKAGKAPVLPGDGSEVHDYIYVGDVARANILAMTSNVSGASFNIVSGKDESLNDVVNTLLRVTGSKLRPEYRDDPARVRFTTSTKLGYRRDKAEKLLGWVPQVGLEEGIRRLVTWIEADRKANPS